MSDSNLAALAIQRETTWATTPSPVNLVKLRFTKEAIEHGKQTVESSEVRDDRQTEETVEVGFKEEGSIDFELSVGTFDGLLEAALQSAFTTISSVPTLRNGTTRYSYLIEKRFSSSTFISFSGMMVDQFTLSVKSRQIITGQFTFLGKDNTSASTSLDTGGYSSAGDGPIMSASAHVGNILEAGVAIGKVKSIDLTVNNNLRENDIIGQKAMDAVGVGSCKVTGKMEVYFSTLALYDKMKSHSRSSISFEASREPTGAVTGDHVGYRFTIPRFTFPKGTPTVSGKDTDVMLTLEFAGEASIGVKASGTLTLSGNAANNETVVIDGKTYTFKTTLSAQTDGWVLIGATASDSIDNLIAAITLGSGSGTLYGSSTTVHSTVTATQGAGDTMTVTAQAKGTAGNSIATTETMTNGAFGAATLASGVDSYMIQIEKLLKA